MAKSTRTLVLEWTEKYFNEDMQAQLLKDEIGGRYAGWSVNIGEGAITIIASGSSMEITIMRDNTDMNHNSKEYRFSKYKVCHAALEAVSAVFWGIDRQYCGFVDFADTLEAILDVMPYDYLTKKKPKKEDE